MYIMRPYLKLLYKGIAAAGQVKSCLLNFSTSTFSKCCNSAVRRQLKSHSCGKLRLSDVGKKVRLRGFLQYHRMKFMLVLRDTYGKIQVVLDRENKQIIELLDKTRFESYVEVIGTVNARPEGQINKRMETGEVEINAEEINILNEVYHNLPFLIRDHNCPIESLALKYRYLDLRHPRIQDNLRFRSKVGKKMRDYLQDVEDFVEINTPTLSVNTPGGAQEFVVPTRFRGEFYSLVQSPQTYKQLLMVGGLEKYFQFAPCFRDEGAKSDRQPEFIQLDLEMADVTKEEVTQLMENVVVHSWMDSQRPSLGFPSITYAEAIDKYGTDKPDTRFGWTLCDVTDIISKSNSDFFMGKLSVPGSAAVAMAIPQGNLHIKNKEVKQWETELSNLVSGITRLIVTSDQTMSGTMAKFLTEDAMKELIAAFSACQDDLIIMAIGNKDGIHKALGRIRLSAAEILEKASVDVRPENSFNFLWVKDFPLFEKDEDSDQLVSCHHPFTQPHHDDISLLYEDPLKARSQHYDLVLNGNEIAGGSIRVHDPEMQKYILNSVLKINCNSLEFLLKALAYGAPPHGGIALGFDRYISVLRNCKSIRDAIAFPKTSEGRCLMTGAPQEITSEEKLLYHINTTKNCK